MTTQFIQSHKPQGRFSHIASGLLLILVLFLVIGISIAPFFPNKVTPAIATSADFSAQRAWMHLPIIAKAPHPTGSPAQADVREYLIQQLTALGLTPEIQQSGEIENILVRLPGSTSTGAIVVLAHYDSVSMGPGAADNSSGVAVLLEIVRALTASPPLQNDIIALFDDAEEGPPPFRGTWLFAREHPWMADVKVAIGMDTAARGFITVNDTGSRNGMIVDALARINRGYYWSSATGGGTYDTWPLRQMGKQVVELEDNYCFRQQHTAFDTVEIIKPATLQQLGDQALSLTRELGNRDISSPWGTHQTFFSLPLLGIVHYPETWSLPLSVLACLMLIASIVLALRRKIATGWGLLIALISILVTIAITTLIVSMVWEQIPHLLSWKTSAWPEWPEVIPTDGGLILAAVLLFALDLSILAFRLSRARSRLADLSLVSLVPCIILVLVMANESPRSIYLPLWPALIGLLGWLVSLTLIKKSRWMVLLPSFIVALATLVFIAPVPLLSFFSTGLNDIPIMAAVACVLFMAVLPAIEGVVYQIRAVN